MSEKPVTALVNKERWEALTSLIYSLVDALDRNDRLRALALLNKWKEEYGTDNKKPDVSEEGKTS